jgi:hypothetical protein
VSLLPDPSQESLSEVVNRLSFHGEYRITLGTREIEFIEYSMPVPVKQALAEALVR